jgi:hypothetical protein
MGSRSDELIYWCSFAITLSYNSLQSVIVYDSLHSLLDHERLPFYYDERKIPAHTLNCLERCRSLESPLIHFWLLALVYLLLSLSLSLMLRPTVSRPVWSWNKAPISGLRPNFYYSQSVAGLLMWGALPDERAGLSFTIAAGACQRSHSQVQVQWDSRPHFTVSDSRLLFSSSPTIRRVTVEVFDPTSTREI